MRHDQCPHEITATMTVYIRPTRDQATEHTHLDGGEDHGAPAFAEELLTVDGCRRSKSQFIFRGVVFVGLLCTCG